MFVQVLRWLSIISKKQIINLGNAYSSTVDTGIAAPVYGLTNFTNSDKIKHNTLRQTTA